MTTQRVIRIAMWSGPRNISTAMMRAWGNRSDTHVVDEPFYAFYLQRTGSDHPGREEVIAQGETDWRKVVVRLTEDEAVLQSSAAGRVPIFYQKQMTHHLLPEVGREWLRVLKNCFLLRHPGEVIASYLKKNHDPTVEDLGFMQQEQLFDFVREEVDANPPVVDAREVLENPGRMLRLLCETVGVEYTEAMLSWPSGLRETDGIWAKHWYGEVASSTGFRPYNATPAEIPARLRPVYETCLAVYERLHAVRLH